MTACTNNGGSRARRAVTAALVGVLSVGAAPMVALATEAAPVAGDVQVMATENNAFRDGTVQYSNGESGASFVYNQKFQGLTPESFTDFGATAPQEVAFTYSTNFSGGMTAGDYYYAYGRISQSGGTPEAKDSAGNKTEYLDEDGEKATLRVDEWVTSDTTPVEPGTYAVYVYKATGANTFVSRGIADTFTVVNGGLEDATLVDDGDVSDSTFEYLGTGGSAEAKNVFSRLDVAVDGTVLVAGTNYDVDSFHEKDKNVDLRASSDLLEVGKTYVLDITGKGAGYEGVKASLEFKFAQLDLDNVTVVGIGATTGKAPETGDIANFVKELNGEPATGLADARFDVTVSGPDSNGVYTYTITSSKFDDENNDLVKGTATVKVAVGDDNATFTYGGSALNSSAHQWGSDTNGYTFTYEKTDPSDKPFDVTKLAAATDLGEDVAITYTVQNAKTGEVGTVDNLDDRGEWIVTAVANERVDGQRWVGSVTITVFNKNELTDAANVFVSYDGELVPSGQDIKGTYDGTDLLDKLSVTVKAGDETLVEGTDYTVEVTTKDQTGKTVKVDEVVDAGDYTVTIKGATFGLDTNTYDFKVAQRTLKTISPSNAFATEDTYFGTSIVLGTKYYYAHTGEEIAPEFTFTGDDGKTYTVPADQFEVTYKKNVNGAFQSAKLKDEGIYVIDSITLDADNFTGTVTAASTSDRIEVTKTGSFVDVPNDAWYAEEVGIAKQQGYIGGVGGTNFFAPMNNISRADVACVLYRMAGGKIGTVEEGMTNEELTYISSFEDVDPNAYYAKAIAWTTKMGVTNGYGTTFGISRDITTEEFVTMLARYAKVTGADTSVDADAVLAKVADGDKVTGYARESVAWAVEQGILAKDGNLIDPQGTIYRARAVKIAVDFQPEQLDTILGTGSNAQDK